MNQSALDNLLRIGQLKAEPRNLTEVMRFLSAYNAAHAAALAALRCHGFHSDSRCLRMYT